jgi:hypothetical protein
MGIEHNGGVPPPLRLSTNPKKIGAVDSFFCNTPEFI